MAAMLRFHVPLIEPDGRISRIRLSDKDSILATHGMVLPSSRIVASSGASRLLQGCQMHRINLPAVAAFDAALN